MTMLCARLCSFSLLCSCWILWNSCNNVINAFKLDRETVNQIWKTIYSELPDPFIAPDFEGGKKEVKLSIQINAATFQMIQENLICHVTMQWLLEWPTNKNVLNNELIKSQKGVLLDPTKVWHPKLLVTNALHSEEISKHFEVRVDGDLGKFSLIQSVKVTIHCDSNKFLFPLGTARCSLLLSQDGISHLHPSIVWQNRRHCLVKRSSMGSMYQVHTSLSYPNKIDPDADESQLVLNICWRQGGGLLFRLLLSTSLILLLCQLVQWGCCPSSLRLPLQALLLAILVALWNFTSISSVSSEMELDPIHESNSPTHYESSSPMSLTDVWCVLCIVYTLLCFLLQLVYLPLIQKIMLGAASPLHQPLRPTLFMDTPRPLSSTQDYFQDFRPPDECMSSNCAGKCSCRFNSDQSSNIRNRTRPWLRHACITCNIILPILFVCFALVLWLFIYPKHMNDSTVACSSAPNCLTI